MPDGGKKIVPGEQYDDMGDRTIVQDDYNVSNESLIDCSQHTSYSQFGEDDICDAILAYAPASQQPAAKPEPMPPPPPATQLAADPAGPPDSSSSGSSLGKRKASDVSSSSSISTGPFRPTKLARPVVAALPQIDPEDNPFFVAPGAANPPPPPVDNIFTPISISPQRTLLRMFEKKQVPYGVQYEIARYVSLGKLRYQDVLVEWLDEFMKLGTNREAMPLLAKKLRLAMAADDEPTEEAADDGWQKPFEKEHSAKLPWAELDREEEALGINQYGGLGFNEKGEYLNWYGGKVLFHGKLYDTADKACTKPKYKLQLDRAELGPSNMFARRFGSKHFFRLKLTKPVMNKSSDELMTYLRRPLILCGSVFRAFYAKDSNVFYVKTNESTDGVSVPEDGDVIPGVKSFLEFVEWHNPMDNNNEQTMAKYVSRFALGLSSSIPGLRIESGSMKFIDDIVSDAGSNMTDGAGKINRWSLNQIRHLANWEERPTAIQIRLLGTKGLLVDATSNAEERAYVELTPSQRKIKFPDHSNIDPAHCIIDVLRSSHARTPCRLSAETIMNLAENGVKRQVFFDLLDKGLKELVEPLLDWESPDAMRTLWTNVRRLGGVMSSRRAREEVGLARVKGYSEKDAEDEANDEDGFTTNIDPAEQRSSAWWVDETSGCPSSLEETIMYMIDSGFSPLTSPLLRDKLDKFIRSRVKNYVKSYRIDVRMSASAFLVPDTTGTLEAGEIFFKSSRRQFITPEGMETDLIVGDVLITRHPCKLPTDIQKWKAVDRPALYGMTDVIVCSTKGDRRAADLLSGGDYDGDKGILTWQPELVAPFKNAPLKYSNPPANIDSYFSRENEEVKTFQHKIATISVHNKIRQLQHHLLGAVRDTSIVGKYSGFHEMAIYTLGYAHQETIRLAYMFCMALDGIKTGMTVSREVLRLDSKQFQKRPPKWKESDEEKIRYETTNELHPRRPPTLGKFIMDDLYKHAEIKSKHWNVQLDELFKKDFSVKQDPELAEPWFSALGMANRWKTLENNGRALSDLERICKHVEAMYVAHRGEMSSPRKQGRGSPRKADGMPAFSSMSIEAKQDKMRDLSRRFAASPVASELLMSKEEIARVRASYAYVYDWEQRRERPPGFTRFPWDMAMRELCAIKARATGRWKTVAGDFYDHFNMKNPKTHHT